MVKHQLDGAVGIPKVLFIEFFDILFFDAVYDALYPDDDDRLLLIKFFLECLCFCLKGEDFKWG